LAERIRREREPSHLARRPPDRAGRTSPWIRSQWIPPRRRPNPGSPGSSRPPLLSEPRTATSAWQRRGAHAPADAPLAGVSPPGPQLAAGRRGAREGETTPRPLPRGRCSSRGRLGGGGSTAAWRWCGRERRWRVAGEFGELAVARGLGGRWAVRVAVGVRLPPQPIGAGSVASASSSCCGPRCQSQPPGLT